jgi:hypothetical protein
MTAEVETFEYAPLDCPKCGGQTGGIGTIARLEEITFASVIWCAHCKFDVRKIAETAVFAKLGVIRKWKAGRK